MIEDVSIETGDPRAAVPFLRRRLRRGPDEAADVVSRLRPMILATPNDPGFKLAAAEASLASGDSVGAWSFVQDLIDPARPAETSLLRLVVLCVGDSPEMLRKVFSFITARTPSWIGQPEVIFAAGEAAGRAGEIGEALDRFRAAAAGSPEAASVCHAAIRRLWESFKQMRARGGPRSHDQEAQICALLAEALLDAGDPAVAAETIRAAGNLTAPASARLADKLARALKSDPTNLGLRGALAEVSLACGQVGRALEIARAGLAGREDPASAPLTLTYGDALARAGKPAEATRAYATAARRDPALLDGAIERLRKVIESDRSIETAHLALGRMLAHTGRVEEGVAEMMSAWSLNGELGAAILKDLERAARTHPGEPCIGLASSKILLRQNEPAGAAAALGALAGQGPGMLDEVLSGLEGIVAAHASCARAHLELGRAFLAKRLAARSCESLMRAHEIDRALSDQVSACLSELQLQFPDEPEPHIARGRLHEEQGRAQQAAEAWFTAVSVGGAAAPKALDALRRLCLGGRTIPGRIHLIRAGACRLMGAMDDAVEAGEAALNAAGDLAAEVRAEMDRIIAILPSHAGARLVRASACIRSMDMQAASEELREAARLDPGCSGNVASLAREIVQRQPGFPPAVRVLADSLARGGDTAGAVQCLDSALSTTQGRRDLNLILARRTLALAAGDSVSAKDLLARAEAVATDRDDLLAHLHREALASGRDASAAPGVSDEIRAALARGDYALAGELSDRQPHSPLRAWILERCGRPAEAAACLKDLLRHAGGQDCAGLAGSYTMLHDRWVARELEGRAPALMAETVVRFVRVVPGERRAIRAARAAAGAEGGER
jgi:tetratricopeptide (TPR) repeat protein